MEDGKLLFVIVVTLVASSWINRLARKIIADQFTENVHTERIGLKTFVEKYQFHRAVQSATKIQMLIGLLVDIVAILVIVMYLQFTA